MTLRHRPTPHRAPRRHSRRASRVPLAAPAPAATARGISKSSASPLPLRRSSPRRLVPRALHPARPDQPPPRRSRQCPGRTRGPNSTEPAEGSGNRQLPVILLSAHLDTVFPATHPPTPPKSKPALSAPAPATMPPASLPCLASPPLCATQNSRPPSPSSSPPTSAKKAKAISAACGISSTQVPYAPRIAAAIALEGGGSSAVVTRALACRRFRVDRHRPRRPLLDRRRRPNPIVILAAALARARPPTLPSRRAPHHAQHRPDRRRHRRQLHPRLRLRLARPPLHRHRPARQPPNNPRLSTPSNGSITSPPRRISLNIPISPLTIETIGDRPGGCLPAGLRSSPPSAPSTATSTCAPNPASAPPTPTSRYPSMSRPLPSEPAASAAASTHSRSGTTPPAANPPSAASSSPPRHLQQLLQTIRHPERTADRRQRAAKHTITLSGTSQRDTLEAVILGVAEGLSVFALAVR